MLYSLYKVSVTNLSDQQGLRYSFFMAKKLRAKNISAYNSLYVCMTSHWFLNWTCHKFKVPLLVPLGKSWLYYFQVWSPRETFTEDDRWRSSHSLLILYLRYPWTTDDENICQGLIYSLSPVSLNYRWWKHMPRFNIFFISGIL